MATDLGDLFDFDDSFAREVPELSMPWQADQVPAPAFVEFNRDLAAELGIDSDALHSPVGLALLSGATVPEGVTPVAMAYAGHQFGGFSPRLGDGRALLLGEVIDTKGVRRDVHLKGSGRTPFARGGDGRAAVGPMLREYLIAEALHALGIPTTRALAVVSTGESIMRDRGPEPGAILTRVAASHLRVGTFEYAARLEDPSVLVRLADHAIERHHPAAAASDTPYLALLDAVVAAQAALIADWMLVGFIHGVMNTDNMTISGEGIDYGPCAFMDRYDPMTVFSSIDRDGRYAYGNQPGIAQWNLARLAETLLPLIDDDADSSIAAATEVLQTFPQRYRSAWEQGMSAKLGLPETDGTLAVAFLDLLAELGADYTTSFRDLARSLREAPVSTNSLTADPAAGTWIDRWRSRVIEGGHDPLETAERMDRVNPIYIPRNHLVQAALDVATAEGDLAPFDELFEVLTDPCAERQGLERFAAPAPDEFDLDFKTFCGT